MKSHMKKILVLIPSILLVLVIMGGFLFYKNLVHVSTATEILWEYRDNVSDTLIWDINGKSVLFPRDSNKIVMFLSSDCRGCIDSLGLLEKVSRIICQDQDVDLMLLWENEIPKAAVEKHQLSGNSYSLHNIKVASGYGCAFFVDADDCVQFYDNAGMKNVLLYVMDNVKFNSDIMVRNANEYLMEKYGIRDRTSLFYFSMPGCPDCAIATSIIDEYGIADIYNMTRIELEKGAKVSDITDECEIYRTAYSIDWYPSFLLIEPSGEFRIIRQVDIDELIIQLTDFTAQVGT